MSFYRSRSSGEAVEAAQFKGAVERDGGMICFGTDSAPVWLCAAMDSKVLELSVLGFGTSSLILNHRGGSYGIAAGDWIVRLSDGELAPCRGDRFAERYEPV